MKSKDKNLSFNFIFSLDIFSNKFVLDEIEVISDEKVLCVARQLVGGCMGLHGHGCSL